LTLLWKGFRIAVLLSLCLALLLISALFGVLLYGKWTGKEWPLLVGEDASIAYAEAKHPEADDTEQTPEAVPVSALPMQAMLSAPAIRQFPELHSGCEVTSLAMLLNYYGFSLDKMELVPQLKLDPTPIRWSDGGSIAYWGNPNTGFVGDITGKAKGFGVYHGPLLDLLRQYIPSGIDLTGEPFDKLERQISDGFPVIAWTTINFQVPDRWVVWDSPAGQVRTTFMEHAVLLVGYDKDYVYVNDPYTGKAALPVGKEQFIASWQAMGGQALSYIQSLKSEED